MTTTPTIWKASTLVNTSQGGGGQDNAVIAPLIHGGYVVVWRDQSGVHNPGGDAIVAQRYDFLGEKIGGEVEIHAGQVGAYDDVEPAVTTLPNGKIVIALTNIIGSDSDIIVSVYSQDLIFDRTDLIDTSSTITEQPSITGFADNSYVVSYTVGGDSPDTDIVARRVSAAGVFGAPFFISSGEDNRGQSQLATLSNGNFVAVYSDEASDTDRDVVFRIMTSTGGQVLGPMTVIGSGNAANEGSPDVAAIANDRFAMVWQDQGTTSGDIRAAVVNNAGVTVLSDILVNTTTAGEQSRPTVVALDTGFLVSWNDNEANRVRAQRFDGNGNKIGSEVTIRSEINTGGIGPQAARLADGRTAYAIGDDTNPALDDSDVVTSIWDGRTSPINGTDGLDKLTSRVEGASLFGFGSTDALYGRNGPDKLDGGGANDIMDGRGGNDTYYVDHVADAIIETAGQGTDTVIATTGYTLAAGVSVEVMRTTGSASNYAIALIGNELGQTLQGNAAANTLDGKGGADAMQGFSGTDSYRVDDAGDTVTEAVGGGTDNIRVMKGMSYTLAAGVQVEALHTQGPTTTYGVNLHGSDTANTILGNNGPHVLSGGLGNEVLMLGYGAADTFRFNTTLGASNVDSLPDFSVADDTIQISNTYFSGLVDGALPASAFHIGSAATTTAHRIIYNSTTGALMFDSNGSTGGSANAVQFATLTTGLTLTAADFVVI